MGVAASIYGCGDAKQIAAEAAYLYNLIPEPVLPPLPHGFTFARESTPASATATATATAAAPAGAVAPAPTSAAALSQTLPPAAIAGYVNELIAYATSSPDGMGADFVWRYCEDMKSMREGVELHWKEELIELRQLANAIKRANSITAQISRVPPTAASTVTVASPKPGAADDKLTRELASAQFLIHFHTRTARHERLCRKLYACKLIHAIRRCDLMHEPPAATAQTLKKSL